VAPPLADQADLLAAAREGDHEAGHLLMREHGPAMVRTAWAVLGRYGGNEADDVVQEAFIAALTTPSLPSGNVGAWLRAITARKALDAARAAKRRGEEGLIDVPHHDASANDVLAVREGLARLAPADRAVLVLVDLEGRSMTEAASALGITNVAARLRAVRARRKLAKILERVR